MDGPVCLIVQAGEFSLAYFFVLFWRLIQRKAGEILDFNVCSNIETARATAPVLLRGVLCLQECELWRLHIIELKGSVSYGRSDGIRYWHGLSVWYSPFYHVVGQEDPGL